MKLKRNIAELPPLSGRLDRRFALPRALDIFQRLSARTGLRRLWSDLPYMRFVQPRAHRPGEAHARAIAPVHQHSSSFHTHIAVSPVIRQVVREELDLPVRELDWRAGESSRQAVAGDAPLAPPVPPALPAAAQRITRLVRVVEEKRPSTVRAVAMPAQDLVQPVDPGGRSHAAMSSPAIEAQPVPPAPSVTGFQAEEAETMRTLAKEFDLDALQLNSGSREVLDANAGESTAASMQPILPPELRERLNLDAIEKQETKRFAARRSGNSRKAAEDASPASADAAPTDVVRVPSKSTRSTSSPQLEYAAESSADLKSETGVAPRTTLRSAPVRPVIERETPQAAPVQATAVRPEISEAEQAQRVQATVRETLRSLPEPDVEAFASRVSRSIERRLRIDQEWRGSL